jgi:hypothetical protein
MIGTTSNAYKPLSGFLGLELPEKRENENKESYFNVKIFYDEDVASFINEHNARDTFIYNIIKDEIEPRFIDQYESGKTTQE